jgi:hypothetical protein
MLVRCKGIRTTILGGDGDRVRQEKVAHACGSGQSVLCGDRSLSRRTRRRKGADQDVAKIDTRLIDERQIIVIVTICRYFGHLLPTGL